MIESIVNQMQSVIDELEVWRVESNYEWTLFRQREKNAFTEHLGNLYNIEGFLGMQEYVVNGESGTIVPPSDVRALTNALIDLLSNEEKRKSYGALARKRALELYDRKITATKTLELYQFAANNFALKQKFALYRKEKDQLLASSEELLKTFDQMIYDLMYRRSLRFRLSYWFHMFKDRPKLFVANLAYNGASKTLKLFGRDQLPERLQRLKSLIDKQGTPEKTT